MGREIIRQESLEEPGERSRLWMDKESYKVLTEKTGNPKIKVIVLRVRNERVTLETDAFTKMRNLKLLDLKCVELKGNYQSFPKEIRWLQWDGFPLEHIPNDFRLDKLVVLKMSKSNLKKVWEIPKVRLPQLKILDLSSSEYLTETPDFSLIPELERLILSDCEKGYLNLPPGIKRRLNIPPYNLGYLRYPLEFTDFVSKLSKSTRVLRTLTN